MAWSSAATAKPQMMSAVMAAARALSGMPRRVNSTLKVSRPTPVTGGVAASRVTIRSSAMMYQMMETVMPVVWAR